MAKSMRSQNRKIWTTEGMPLRCKFGDCPECVGEGNNPRGKNQMRRELRTERLRWSRLRTWGRACMTVSSKALIPTAIFKSFSTAGTNTAKYLSNIERVQSYIRGRGGFTPFAEGFRKFQTNLTLLAQSTISSSLMALRYQMAWLRSYPADWGGNLMRLPRLVDNE